MNADLKRQMNAGFKKQQEDVNVLKGMTQDFLSGKVHFKMTPIKRRRMRDALNDVEEEEMEDDEADYGAGPLTNDTRLQPPAKVSRTLNLVSASSRSGSPRGGMLAEEVPAPSPVSPVSYRMSRTIHTVTDLYKEWTVGLGTGPSVASLNDQYGVQWRVGWPHNEREFYLLEIK